MTPPELQTAELAAGLHDRANSALRVRWIGALRSIVARRCPKNHVGASLVSDVDLVLATLEERVEALGRVSA